MNENQAERSSKISSLMMMISQQLEKEEAPKKHDWILWCMDKFNTSQRTAREYVTLAFMRMKLNG